MAEAVLQHVVKQRGLNIFVDSAGTAGYHVGEEPDSRCEPRLCRPNLYSQTPCRTVDTCKKVGTTQCPDTTSFSGLILDDLLISTVSRSIALPGKFPEKTSTGSLTSSQRMSRI